MKKHETYKRNNNTDMQKQNKKTNKIDTPGPHNGYKYKSLFIIIKSAMNVLVFKIR